MERSASGFREGDVEAFETVTRVVTPELAYVVWVERHRSKIGERDEILSFPSRVTIIFSLEDDTWKVAASQNSLDKPREPVIVNGTV